MLFIDVSNEDDRVHLVTCICQMLSVNNVLKKDEKFEKEIDEWIGIQEAIHLHPVKLSINRIIKKNKNYNKHSNTGSMRGFGSIIYSFWSASLIASSSGGGQTDMADLDTSSSSWNLKKTHHVNQKLIPR